MTTPQAPPSRYYLVPAIGALILGVVTLVAHFRQPSFPALPGRGCIVTTFLRPQSRVPTPYLELSACLHISEAILELVYHDAPEPQQRRLFEAYGVEDPREWARSLTVEWVTADTIRIRYRPNIRFTERAETVGPILVLYVPLPADGI